MKTLLLSSLSMFLCIAINARSTPKFTSLGDEDYRKQIAREIVDNLTKDDYQAVAKDFSNVLKQQLSPQNIGDAWSAVVAQLGKFQSKSSERVAIIQGYNQVIIRCKFEVDSLNVEVTFNENDKVIGLYLKP